MRPPFLRPRTARSPLIAFLVVLLLLVPPTIGQGAQQDPPLLRREQSHLSFMGPDEDITSTQALRTSNQVWVPTSGQFPMQLAYACIRASSTSSNPELDPGNQPVQECSLGTPGGSTGGQGRQVELWYTTNGVDPKVDDTDNATSVLLTAPAADAIPGGRNDLAFSDDNIYPATGLTAGNGSLLKFIVAVRVTGTQDPGDVNCGRDIDYCLDPPDTTGQGFYQLRLDNGTPMLEVADPVNANVFVESDDKTWLYSSHDLSGTPTSASRFLPTIRFDITDNRSGAPLDLDSFTFERGTEDQTELFSNTCANVTGSRWTCSFAYDYTDADAAQFTNNSLTDFSIKASDQSGRDRDATLNVVMDGTKPSITDTNITLEPANRTKDFAALGEQLEVWINATDIAAGSTNSPGDALNVSVIFNGPNGTKSAPQRIPYLGDDLSTSSVNERERYHGFVTIPDPWFSGRLNATVRVTDPALNFIEGFAQIPENITVDPDRPQILPRKPLDDTSSFTYVQDRQVRVTISATDTADGDDWDGADTDDTDGFGVDHDTVRMSYKIGKNGVVRSQPLRATAESDTFSELRTFNAGDNVYYFFEATDFAGNTGTYPGPNDPHVLLENETRNGGRFLRFVVDTQGPQFTPEGSLDFLSAGPHPVNVRIKDAGIGVDPFSPVLNWRLQGSNQYLAVPMQAQSDDTDDGKLFSGNIPAQTDGDIIEFYVTAADLLGNEASFGTASAPRQAVIDTQPPTVTVTAPATSANARFTVEWAGSDARSGVADYTLQFRVAPNGAWTSVPERTETELTSYEICAATGKTYQFRVSARDIAGNERAFPENADAATEVTAAESCAVPSTVNITAPASGATVRGDVAFSWDAVSTTFPDELTIRIDAGRGGTFNPVATGIENDGTHTWKSSSANQDDACFEDGTYTFRITATDPLGLQGSATVDNVKLDNGIDDCTDRDGDGLPDAWEFSNFGDLDRGADDDADNDGATNAEEFAAGTDPNDASSTPGGGGGTGTQGGGTAAEGWNPLYLLVVLGFVTVLAVFLVGMARRW